MGSGVQSGLAGRYSGISTRQWLLEEVEGFWVHAYMGLRGLQSISLSVVGVKFSRTDRMFMGRRCISCRSRCQGTRCDDH